VPRLTRGALRSWGRLRENCRMASQVTARPSLDDTDDVLADRSTFTDRLVIFYWVAFGILIYASRANLPGWPQFLVVHFFGITAVVVLLFAGIVWHPAKVLRDWYPLLIFVVGFEEVALLSHLVVPAWQDGYILALEAAVFPVPPTAWFAGIASPLLTELMQIGYFSFYLVSFVVGVPLYAKLRPAFHWMMATLMLTYLFCFAIYIGFPTEGPRHTLAHLHAQPLTGGVFHWLVNLMQRAGVHGNAFPSAHVAAGTVCLLYAWRFLPQLGRWLAPFVALMCIGAVYDRYHYVTDVAGGIAVALLAWGLMRQVEKRPPLAIALRLPAPEDLHSSA